MCGIDSLQMRAAVLEIKMCGIDRD